MYETAEEARARLVLVLNELDQWHARHLHARSWTLCKWCENEEHVVEKIAHMGSAAMTAPDGLMLAYDLSEIFDWHHRHLLAGCLFRGQGQYEFCTNLCEWLYQLTHHPYYERMRAIFQGVLAC